MLLGYAYFTMYKMNRKYIDKVYHGENGKHGAYKHGVGQNHFTWHNFKKEVRNALSYIGSIPGNVWTWTARSLYQLGDQAEAVKDLLVKQDP